MLQELLTNMGQKNMNFVGLGKTNTLREENKNKKSIGSYLK